MRADLVAKKVVVEVIFDMVRIELHCGDDYAAQILHEDLCDRLRKGEKISLAMAVTNGETT